MHLSLIRELFKEEFTPIAERLGGLEEDVRLIRNNFDNMQAALRNAKKDTVEIKLAVEKLARIEDTSRQSNIRLVGLKEGVEGDDPLRFIQNQLPKWIPSVAGKVMEIERAHRIYSGECSKNNPSYIHLQDDTLSRSECDHEWRPSHWTNSSYGNAAAFLPRLQHPFFI